VVNFLKSLTRKKKTVDLATLQTVRTYSEELSIWQHCKSEIILGFYKI